MILHWYADYSADTVNPEIFAIISLLRIVLKDIHVMLKKFATMAGFTYVSNRQNDFAISQGFYFHKTYAKFREK